MKRKLYKTEGPDRMMLGVCGGVAEFFDIDPTVVRVVWAISFAAGGAGFWAYFVCAFIMPNKSDIYYDC